MIKVNHLSVVHLYFYHVSHIVLRQRDRINGSTPFLAVLLYNVRSWIVCVTKRSILSVSVADPGSGAFLTPGSGMGRKSASGSGIRDEQPGSYFLELRNHFHFFGFLGLKYLNFLMRIRDPGWRQFVSGIRDGKKSNPGSGINIPDPQHCFPYRLSWTAELGTPSFFLGLLSAQFFF